MLITRKLVIKLKINKALILIFVLIFNSLILTGCWNYKEVDELAIAAGVAVDKNADDTVHLTIEVVNISGGTEATYEPKYIESDGNTFFEAVRRAIAREGRRVYWSHAKVAIVSEELAREDILKYLDFLFRDAETREDSWLLISREKKAGEILQSKGILNPIVSFQIDDTMRAQKSISRFPFIQLYEFFDRVSYQQVSAIAPTVQLVEQHGEKTPLVGGTAIFKKEKLIGFLNEEDTKMILWLRDEVQGGLVIIKNVSGTKDNVTLEIFNSKSKITPLMQEGVLKIKVEVDLDVGIGEIFGSTDFINNPGKQKLIKAAEDNVEGDIKKVYTMIRDKYKADVFGFGRRIEMKMPGIWKQIKQDWDKFFAELEIDVDVNVKIRGSATTRIPLKAGE
jgi:spore germination protein KC